MNQSINTDSKNSKEPQQKYRLGTVSIKILGGLNRFYRRLTSPSASIMAQNIQLFESRLRRDSSRKALHCTEPFLFAFPSSRYDWNAVERDVKPWTHHLSIRFGYVFFFSKVQIQSIVCTCLKKHDSSFVLSCSFRISCKIIWKLRDVYEC